MTSSTSHDQPCAIFGVFILYFLTSVLQEKLAEICVKYHYILYNKDETLSPLGQVSIFYFFSFYQNFVQFNRYLVAILCHEKKNVIC